MLFSIAETVEVADVHGPDTTKSRRAGKDGCALSSKKIGELGSKESSFDAKLE